MPPPVNGGYRQARMPTCSSYPLKGTILVQAINLADKLSMFSEHWQPRVVGQFNGHDLMVVKVKGEFVWHKHDDTDDFFLVLSGRIVIQLRDGAVRLGPGEVFVVPRGVEHRPVAEDEAHILLIEPRGTPNTGNTATAADRRVI
jgi:mannose-6-phosphate isomerase-like protein (cupin superfamily)